MASDQLPYPTLSYANGDGYYNTYDEAGRRQNMSTTNFTNPNLLYMSMVPMDDEAHGGDDIGVYASGPWSHLFSGSYEQNNIPVAMAYAAQIGPYATGDGKCDASKSVSALSVTLLLMVAFAIALIS